MIYFPMLTLETASDAGKARLQASLDAYNFIPNLHGVMAHSPALLEAYQALNDIFMRSSSFNATERDVVWLAVNYWNNCHYCMAAHSALAAMSGMNEADLEALRTGQPLANAKLQTLRSFTEHMLEQRGWPDPQQIAAMEDAGYTATTILDVILAIGMKILSNYTNHLADTPVDNAFTNYAWTKPAETADTTR